MFDEIAIERFLPPPKGPNVQATSHNSVAVVGVVDEPAGGAPASQRHLQGVDHELLAQVAGHRPADD
jgi:hypothetical protein